MGVKKREIMNEILFEVVDSPFREFTGKVDRELRELGLKIAESVETDHYEEKEVLNFWQGEGKNVVILLKEPHRLPYGVVDLVKLDTPDARILMSLYEKRYGLYLKKYEEIKTRVYKWLMCVKLAEISEEDTRFKFRDELTEFYKFIDEESRLWING